MSSKDCRGWARNLFSSIFAATLLIGSLWTGDFYPAAYGKDTSAAMSSPGTTALVQKLLPSEVAGTIADYATSGGGEIKPYLLSLGLSGDILPPDFLSLSPVQQLQWAYGAVEMNKKGTEKYFLSAFITNVSTDIPSILLDPSVKTYIYKFRSDSNTFKFKAGAPSVAKLHIDSSVNKVIALVVEAVSSRGSVLPPRFIMEKDLELKQEDVVKLLLKYGSGKEALTAALNALSEPPQKEKLAKIALELFSLVPAAKTDSILNEAIFRWIGLDDPVYGEWFRYRDKLIETVEAGEMDLPVQKKADMQETVRTMGADFAKMPMLYAQKNLNVTPKAIERMFFSYTKHEPSVAALWGFSVIAFKEDLDFDRYVDSDAQSLKRRAIKDRELKLKPVVEEKVGHTLTVTEMMEFHKLVEDQFSNVDFVKIVKEHGPKPYSGYSEYVRITGFEPVDKADQYFSSDPVDRWVDRMCPG
jgi:hypothetical protein